MLNYEDVVRTTMEMFRKSNPDYQEKKDNGTLDKYLIASADRLGNYLVGMMHKIMTEEKERPVDEQLNIASYYMFGMAFAIAEKACSIIYQGSKDEDYYGDYKKMLTAGLNFSEKKGFLNDLTTLREKNKENEL